MKEKEQEKSRKRYEEYEKSGRQRFLAWQEVRAPDNFFN